MRILVVDDDEISLEMMTEALSTGHGFDLETAADGDEAWQRVSSEDISFVVADWMMPGLTGVELCRKIRSTDLGHYVYFMLVTSHDGRANVVEGLAAGADEFIPKPFDPVELAARVKSLTRLKELHDRIGVQNEELKRSQELKDNWINMIVHDLRSPMMTIIGYSELLQTESGGSRALGTIHREGMRVNNLLEEMLITLKSEVGKLTVARTSADLWALARQAMGGVETMANAKRVRIELECPDDQCCLQVDESLTRRMMDNLLSNAIRFSPEEGAVTLELCATEGEVVLSVVDSGPGLPMESEGTIFEPYRTGGTRNSQHGLGLAFCRLVAEAHGGTIRYVRNKPFGSRFEVRLPGLTKMQVAEVAGQAAR